MTFATNENNPHGLEMVVIQTVTDRVNGYLELSSGDTIEKLLIKAPLSSPETFKIRQLDSDVFDEIPVRNICAVFFVKTFEGDQNHKDLNFHSRPPVASGIWMKVKFLNGEVMEGLVHNSIRYLVDPGFFLLPTDPDSNNKLVYVAKKWLSEHCVLGVRRL